MKSINGILVVRQTSCSWSYHAVFVLNNVPVLEAWFSKNAIKFDEYPMDFSSAKHIFIPTESQDKSFQLKDKSFEVKDKAS